MGRRTNNLTTSLKPLPGVHISAWLEAKRRYSNARRRARYWSGTPSFSVTARSNECRTSELDLKYELAMCDCNSWEQTLEKMTGKSLEHYDPKQAFRRAFSKLQFSSNS